nr:PASTA domain-containing protein [Cellulosimicrobium sp. MM]
MPNLVETRLKQARADLESAGGAVVVVTRATRGRRPARAANGWTVCAQDPEGGDLVRASQTVTLDAAPNAKQCP